MSDQPHEPRDEIVVECTLPEAPEKVWRALTVPELLAAWLLPNDMRGEEGARFSFDGAPGEGGKVECEVLDIEQHRLIRYSWRDEGTARDGLATTVSFRLLPAANGGTHLRVVHEARVLANAPARKRRLTACNSNVAAAALAA